MNVITIKTRIPAPVHVAADRQITVASATEISAPDLVPTLGGLVRGGDSTAIFGGSTRHNHNESMVTDADADADQAPAPADGTPDEAAREHPADLPVTTSDQVKGGPLGGTGFGGSTRLNHNESVDMGSLSIGTSNALFEQSGE